MPPSNIAERVRALVAARPLLADLLERQAQSFPKRVFGNSEMSAAALLDIYLEEADFLRDLVEPYMLKGRKVLEVGGGLGLFFLMMREAEMDAVSVEPSAEGFSYFRAAAVSIIKELTGDEERYVDAHGENLPWPDSSFDLVVSGNVLEHVPDPKSVLAEMYRVCAPGGVVLNYCPNYLFPYEPHYKLPILPCAVGLSGRLFWRRFRTDPLWRSLNSITSWRVIRAARTLPGAQLVFLNTMTAVLQRLQERSHLRERHSLLASLALARPFKSLLQSLPPQILSPMAFEIRKPGPGSSIRK